MVLVKEKFSSIVPILICSIGLIIQLINIGERYFKYLSRSNIAVWVTESTTAPLLSTCWDIGYILDTEKAINMSKNDITGNLMEYYRRIDIMTATDMFSTTPDVDKVFNETRGCSIRIPKDFAAEYPYPNGSKCRNIFNITKYIQRGLMCYKFNASIIDKSSELTTYEYALSPQAPGLIYKIFLNNTIFGDVKYSAAILHSHKTSRLHDSVFSAVNFYERDMELAMSYLTMDITFSEFVIKRLPYPYDTNCVTIDGYKTSDDKILERLRNDTIKYMGRAHSMSAITDLSLDVPALSAGSFRNKSILKQFMEIYNNMSGWSYDCLINYYVTSVYTSNGNIVTISVFMPQDPKTIIHHKPQEDLIDFLMYITSSFGIWLGVSVLSIFELVRNIISKKFPSKRKTTRVDTRIFREHSIHSLLRENNNLKLRMNLIQNDLFMVKYFLRSHRFYV